MNTFIYPQLWLSEAISGFIFTIGALLIWTFVKRESSGLDTKWKKRLFAGLAMMAVTFTAMFAGQFIGLGEGGHGWSNPAMSMGLAFAQPKHVFHVDSNGLPNIFILGIFYVMFQFVGAVVALVVYLIFAWIHNSTSSKQDNLIRLTQLFQMDETHPVRAFSKDAVAMALVAFAFIGGTMLGTDKPSAFPSNSIMRFTSVFAAGFAMMLAIFMIGERGVITMNPIVWFVAFILKFASHILNNRKFRLSLFVTEFSSPVATLGAGLVSGLAVYGIINLPTSVAI